ncbi:MAG: hypothetical protein CSA97_05300, partial [Bacteroidetes bacterium]
MVGLAGIILLALTILIVAYKKKELDRKLAIQTYPFADATISKIRLQRLGEALRLHRSDDGWVLTSQAKADTGRVATLLDLLQSIDLDLPIDLDGKLPQHAQTKDSALSILIVTPDQAPIVYTAIYYDSEHLAIQFPNGEAYTARLLGYKPEDIRYLALDPAQWADPFIGLDRPSELAALTVSWPRHPGNGFALSLDDSLRATLTPIAARSIHLSYDT